MANPSDWAQLYSHTFAKQETPCREDHHHHPFIMSDQISSTTTGMAANTTGSHMATGTNNMMSTRDSFHLSYTPDGRVSKPSRKRTRVSAKKDHTTILNTDISNFRAMVQQFTGAPQSAAFLSTTSSVPRVNLSENYNSSSGMSYEYNQQAGHQLHPYQQQQQQQLMMQLLNNNNSNNNRNDHGFDIGLSNVNKLHVSAAAKMEKSDGFVIADGNSSTTTSSSYEMFPASRLSSFDHENTRSNNGFVSF